MRFWLWTFRHNECAFLSAILYTQTNLGLIHIKLVSRTYVVKLKSWRNRWYRCKIIVKKMRPTLCLLLLSLPLSNAQPLNLRKSSGIFFVTTSKYCSIIYVIHELSNKISIIFCWIHFIWYLTVWILYKYI